MRHAWRRRTGVSHATLRSRLRGGGEGPGCVGGAAMMPSSESYESAAQRLAASALRDGFRPQAVHLYTDQQGNPLHWRIRMKHPTSGDKWIRPMKLNGHGFTLGEPEYPDSKPLYNLRLLAERPDQPVIIVE